MKIIQPYVVIDQDFDPLGMMKNIERKARLCYKSEDKITESSYLGMIDTLVSRNHWAMLDHTAFAVKLVTDRGVTHEVVRHRIGVAYAQESTRFCNYSKDKFGNEITVIEPFFFIDDPLAYRLWRSSCELAENKYMKLLQSSRSPQEARSVLPNSLKTEIWITGDIPFWRHFFILRTAPDAHPQMRQVVIPLLIYMQKHLPLIFDDISYDHNFPVKHYAKVFEGEENERIYLNEQY